MSVQARILVVGAGPLGTLFSARLQEAGHAVTLVARGRRLAELREHGLLLHDTETDELTTHRVPLAEAVEPGNVYDLVLVVMRKNRVADLLPALAPGRSPNIAFLMNNAAGPDELTRALGGRVLLGFPMSGGYFEGPVLHFLGGSERRPMRIPLGEPDGRILERTRKVASLLGSMRGYRVELRRDMDAWLRSHAALLMPGLAAALYGAGGDRLRLARTPDLLVTGVRATREAFRALHALGVPLVPFRLRLFAWTPEPLLVSRLAKMLPDPRMKVALEGHAGAARDEIRHLVDELLVLARKAGTPTPNIERLYPYFNAATPPLPEGSAAIPLKWTGT